MSKDSEIAAEVLRDAANDWQWGGWADAFLPKPTGEVVILSYADRVSVWLRARADRVEQS